MKMRRLSLIALAIVIGAFSTPPLEAQSTSADIEVGYQWVDIEGNEDLYRTQLNQTDGFVLRNLSVNYTDPSGDATFADNFRIDAAGFGGSPAGRFRLWLGLRKSYRVRLFYNQYENFSALPAFANPLLDDGIVPGQHTWDRTRKVLDLEVEILPNSTVTPIVGYRWNAIEGPRQTTYTVGQDEFRLSSDLEETEQEIYAGVTFRTDRFWGTVIQGWRDYEATDSVTLSPGAGAGNNDRPVLGTDVFMDDFSRSTRTEAETPVTTANVQGRFTEMVGFEVSYVRADVEGESSASEMLSGSFVSYQISRFFEGLDQSIESRTENPYWRGEARLNFNFSENVRLDVGYEARSRELEGWALISSLYLDTLNFSGFDPQDIETLVEANNGYEREDQIIIGRLNLREVGPFVLWAEAGVRKTDLDVTADVSQIVIPGGQDGEWERQVDLFGAGAAIVWGAARISLDVLTESADDVIMRTDYDSRSKLRGRIDWTIAQWLRLVTTAELINSSNGTSGAGYEADTEHVAVDLNFDPTDRLSFRLAYDGYTTDTRIPIRLPHSFEVVPSIFSENGTLLEGGLLWRIGIVNLDLGYSNFENTGSFEFDSKRAFARVGVDFTDNWSAAAEYENNDYTEKVLELADFDAQRVGVFLRWRR
jgi:hypothetical protein